MDDNPPHQSYVLIRFRVPNRYQAKLRPRPGAWLLTELAAGFHLSCRVTLPGKWPALNRLSVHPHFPREFTRRALSERRGRFIVGVPGGRADFGARSSKSSQGRGQARASETIQAARETVDSSALGHCAYGSGDD